MERSKSETGANSWPIIASKDQRVSAKLFLVSHVDTNNIQKKRRRDGINGEEKHMAEMPLKFLLMSLTQRRMNSVK
uniref:Ovule protein n=1 Tax=Caenorhabditis tropicalis TaxID=1561998 RepID=A0A1I7TM83_9PELO